MNVKELKKGDKLFIIDWNSYNFQLEVSICEVDRIFDSKYLNDHYEIELFPILGRHEEYTLYKECNLNKVTRELLEFFYAEYNNAFITANEELFKELLFQLIYNKTFNKLLIDKTLRY